MSLLDDLKKRRDYHRTVRALTDMPMEIATDLGIDKFEARTIARRAVYGN